MKRGREEGDREEGDGGTKKQSGRLPKHLAKKLKKQRLRSDGKKETGEKEDSARDHQKEDEKQDDIKYPYTVDDNDHCETPLAAYEDIAPVLDTILRKKGGKSRSDLVIYDPYFCEGMMKQHLASLSFSNVYNEKEDFYKVIESGRVPEYDVFITNPPYSGEHPQKLMDFVTKRQSKPFLLLMPNWVYSKDYFLRLSLPGSGGMYYLSPSARYLYSTPKGRRQKKSSKITSPFPSLWYCGVHGGASQFINEIGKVLNDEKVHLCKDTAHLPLSIAHESDTRKKKERNKLKRKKNKHNKKNHQVTGGS